MFNVTIFSVEKEEPERKKSLAAESSSPEEGLSEGENVIEPNTEEELDMFGRPFVNR